MRKVSNVARLSVALLVTCVMILGLIPVPALAEMVDVTNAAEVAKKGFSEGEQLTPQEMSNVTPADSPKEKSGDAVGELGEETAAPSTESNAVSESPEPAEAAGADALPKPISDEKIARLTPHCMAVPRAAPAIGPTPNADLKIRTKAAGI